MKTAFVLSMLASLVIGAPFEADVVETSQITARQLEAKALNDALIQSRQIGNAVGITENEYTLGGCRDIIFFFARGSTEVGNMGSTVGPPTGQGLKTAFGDASVAVEGVDYAALLSTNFLPGGADPAGISELEDLLQSANSRCPSSILTVGGYSQGAALVHRAIEGLSQSIKDQIAGVVTYGDTQNQQDGQQIPNFPKDKLLIICNTGDAVCQGSLTILAPHLDYVRRVPEAVAFLTGKIRGAQA
ncbi:cutinase [Phlyctema vagabunda]|uniref:Cutinase n=1 Tax=Phlyctema vagabunda TaxID=108571 RepID=A0ABR4PY81_9HELO